MATSHHKPRTLTIALLAGEASGDDLGGAIIIAIKKQARKKFPQHKISFVGIGGTKMKRAGLRSFFPMEQISKMGLLEVLPHLPSLLASINQTIKKLRQIKPDLLVTIDMPDFNKRVAKALKDLPMKKIHVVAPTIWFWRAKRRFVYADIFDEIFCLFPFEPRYFADTKLKAFYMGHPLVREVAGYRPKKNKNPKVLLLAGSRKQELKNHLPLLKDFILQNKFLPLEAEYVFYTLPHLRPIITDGLTGVEKNISIIDDDKKKWQAFFSADLALCCHGTALLEVALAGIPAVGFYRANPLSIAIARQLTNFDKAGLPNILAHYQGMKDIIPELIQEEATVANLMKVGEQQFRQGRAGVKKNYDKALVALKKNTDPATRAGMRLLTHLEKNC